MSIFKSLTDAELAERLSDGDKPAFGELYERYWMAMYLHAKRMLRDGELAEDAVADTFAALLEKIGNIEFKQSLGAFLYRSLKNRIIDMIRAERVNEGYIDELTRHLAGRYPAADEQLLEKELAEKIEREIEQLTPRMRRIFELSRNAHLSHKQIAEQEAIAVGTVRKQIFFALRILKGKIGASVFLATMNVILWLSR